MIKDKNRFSMDYVLNEALVQEDIINIKTFKKYNKEERLKLADKLSVASFKLSIKMLDSSRNAKVIEKSKGDIDNYEGYADILTILGKFNRLSGDNTVNKPDDFNKCLSELNRLNDILVNSKHKNEFKKSFQSGNKLVSSLYISIVSALSMGTLKLFSVYTNLDEVEQSGIRISKKDSNLYNSNLFSSIRKINDLNINGYFSKLFNIETKEYMVNEDPILGGFGALTTIFPSTGALGPVFLTVILILTFLLLIRVFASKIYSIRVDIVDNLRESAEILEENAITLKDGKVKDRQVRTAEKLRRLADKIDIEDSVSDSKSDRIIRTIDSEVVNDFETSDSDSLETNFGF